eukprot:3307317-Pyramimonas_sp.AAC.1
MRITMITGRSRRGRRRTRRWAGQKDEDKEEKDEEKMKAKSDTEPASMYLHSSASFCSLEALGLLE